MVGIASYGVYVPKFRLGAETEGWNSSIERAVANFDEDSVTMAVAAGSECLRGRNRHDVDGLIFASTTPPYAEKQCAAIVAAALDLRQDIFAADVTDVLRAGTTALKMALDAVAAGSSQQVLVVVSDNRQGAPRGDTERNSGDGSVAVLVADNDLVADFFGFHSLTQNMLDNWRSPGDSFVRSWEDRFATEEGLERIMGEIARGFLDKYGIEAGDVGKVALYAPDARRHISLSRQLGFAPDQVQEPLFGRMGNTGAAFPLMLLVNALEESSPGQLLLALAYGDGGDALAFRTADAPNGSASKGSRLSEYLESKRTLDSYETYARWRDVWTTEDGARRPAPNPPSVAALWREADKNLRFYGARCNSCQYVQYPPQQVCVNCRERVASTPIRLSDQPATVFTYSMDYIAGTTDTPLVVAVVDFQCGGRLLCMMTDRELDDVRVGMPVEMSFRKLRVVAGIHNYYWKAIPQRMSAG